ncbi:MAG: hypothetical protein MUF64_15105 [Polyangiaceae bacterium]|nr:hypothetical protein [Polyangiaceae bacterium]
MEPALRVALVTHGLRSVQTTLASVQMLDAEDSEQNRSEAIRALLPVLPTPALPALLSLSTRYCWPHAAVVAELDRRGLTEQALDHLLEYPEGKSEALRKLAPSLSPAQIRRACQVLLEEPYDPGEQPSLLCLAPLLEEVPRRSLLERAAAQWERRVDLSLGVALADAYLAVGQAPSAMEWAQRVVMQLRGERNVSCRWQYLLIQLMHRLLDGGSDAAGALLDELPRRTPLQRDEYLALLRARPTTELPYTFFDRLADRPWTLWQGEEPVPPHLLDRCEGAMWECLREIIDGQHVESSLQMASALAARPLRDRARFLALVPSWRERILGTPGLSTPTRTVFLELAHAVARHDRPDVHDRVVKLLKAMAEQGEEVWEIERWERFFSEEERHTLLLRRLREPLRPPEPHELCARLQGISARPFLDEVPSARGRLWSMVQRAGDGFLHTLPSRLRCLPPEERPALVRATLAETPAVTDHPFGQVLPLLQDAELKAELARRFLAEPQRFQQTRWPVEFFDALPEVEREPRERAFLAQLDEARIRLVYSGPPPAWMRGEVFGKLRDNPDDQALFRHAELLSDPRAEVPEDLYWSLIDALHRELLTTPPVGPHQIEPPAWRALRASARTMRPEALARIVPLMDRAPLVARRLLALRTWELLMTEETTDLFALLEGCARAIPEDLLVQLRVALWRHRRLPPDEGLASALREVANPEATSKLRAIHDLGRLGLGAAVLRHLLRAHPVQEHLDLISELWRQLTQVERKNFHTEIREAAPWSQNLGSIQELCEEMSDETLCLLWRRELFSGGPWVLPAELVRRAGGADGLDAWVQGAEEGFAAGLSPRR